MNHQVASNGGFAPRTTDSHVVALYDAATGRIVHLHTVTVFEGGTSVSEAQAVERAKWHAARRGHQTESLGILTSRDPAHGKTPHQVNLETGTFVPIKADRRKAQLAR